MSRRLAGLGFPMNQRIMALSGSRVGKVIAALLLALTITPVVSAPLGQLPPVPNLVARKEEFDKTVQEQIQLALEALRLKPKSAEANGNLGMILHAHQRYELAEPFYLRARILDSQSFPWAYYLGVIQVPLGKQTQALATLRSAIVLKPDYLPARITLAKTLWKHGKLEESRKAYERILADHPESAAGHYGLGSIYWDTGHAEKAIEHLEKACQLSPGFGASHYALGLAYRSLGNNERMREHLSLFQQNPTQHPPQEDPLLAAIESLGSKISYYLQKGLAHRDQGQLREAAAAFREVLGLETDHAVAHGNLTSLYIALRDPAKVEQHYRAAVRIDPGMYKTHYNFAVFLGMTGRTSESKEVLGKALEVNPYHGLSHNNLGYLLAQEGRNEEAEKHFLLAIQYEPNFSLPRFNLGRLLMTQGKQREAIKHLEKALNTEDENTPAHVYTLALAHAQLGELGKAREYALQAKEKAVGPGQEPVAGAVEELLTRLNKIAQANGQ